MSQKYDYLIIGAGVMGLSIARNLKRKYPQSRIIILEKENQEAQHASGRNSGVLHAGFYYTADSLKAKFTVQGSQQMRRYCDEKGLPVNKCGKLVVALNESELIQLYELEKRGQKNGSNVKIISVEDAKELEPNVRTFQKALHSPDTASISPQKVCESLKDDLLEQGEQFFFLTKYIGRKDQTVLTNTGEFEARKIINCAGVYADKIAHDFGFGKSFTMIPFKGIYLKYTKNKTDIRMNIYPVPNLNNPFLGVHFTKTVGGDIKIGPTAIPALWRENYDGFDNFQLGEMTEILGWETRLFLTNAFGFRGLALEEARKYNKNYFIKKAMAMVEYIDPKGFTEYTQPGIRAQLMDKTTRRLVMDFLIEADDHSVHILNAVSPAFTCAFPFADYIVQEYSL